MNRRRVVVGDRVRCVRGFAEGTRGEVVRALSAVLVIVERGTDRIIRGWRYEWELESEEANGACHG